MLLGRSKTHDIGSFPKEPIKSSVTKWDSVLLKFCENRLHSYELKINRYLFERLISKRRRMVF